MAGCGTCPDQCGCVIVNDSGEQYPGIGTEDNPIVIPEAQNTPFVGHSTDGSITITPGDVVPADADGHDPDFQVNFCNVVSDDVADSGDVLVLVDDDDECRPHRLRDPSEGEVLTRDPVTGQAGWLGGVASFGGDMPYGVPLEFWGSEVSVPSGYGLCDFGLISIADNPNLFATIQFNASGGVDPGGGMFHKPDKRGYVAAGRDDMGGTPANRVTHANADILGGTLGVETIAIALANMPSHAHLITDPGHGHGIGDAGHNHGLNGGRNFVTADTPIATALIANDAPDTLGLVLSGSDLAQKNNSNTAGTVTGVSVIGGGTGITGTQNSGSSTAIPNTQALQPTQFTNYIIRLG